MFTPLTLAFGLGAPFALSAAWLGWVRLGPGRAWRASSVAFSGVAALGAAGFVAALAWQQSKLVPSAGSGWLGWASALWGFVAALDAAAFRLDGSRHLLRVAALTLAFVQVFGKRLEALVGSGLWPAFGLALATALACELAVRAYRRVESPIAECAPMAALAGTSALCLFAGYATLAAVAGATALAYAVLALGASRFRTEAELRAGGVLFATGWLVTLALAGGLFAAPNYAPALWALVALGFLAPALVALPGGERLGSRGRFAIAALLALAPAAAAAWLAYGTYAPNPYG